MIITVQEFMFLNKFNFVDILQLPFSAKGISDISGKKVSPWHITGLIKRMFYVLNATKKNNY